MITRVTLETLWRHSGNQPGLWGVITRVTLETLWRHSSNADTLVTLYDTLASWTLQINSGVSRVFTECIWIFGLLSEC